MTKLSELSKPVAYKFDQLKAKKPADTKTLAAEAAGYVTDDNSGGYYVVECQECGEVYPSQECDGGGQIADSGDYNDALCPHCGCESPDECNDTPLVWNVQQAKINAMLAELEAANNREDGYRKKWVSELSNLQDAGKRIAELERITEGVDQLAIDGGWTARGMSEYAKSLEAKLATPVRLPGMMFIKVSGSAVPVMHGERVKESIRAAGFKCVGDE